MRIGGEHSIERKILDHHQRGFAETFSENHSTKLSSCGLVWRHFGEAILLKICETVGLTLTPFCLSRIRCLVYERLIESIDGFDNGMNVADEPRFFVLTLGNRIASLNREWFDIGGDTIKVDKARFRLAVRRAREWFADTVSEFFRSWIPARQMIRRAVEEGGCHCDDAVVELPLYVPSWKEALLSLEEEGVIEEGKVLFVIFPDYDASWRYAGAPTAPGAFSVRKPMPQDWCGLRGSELSETCGVAGCTFVHASQGFTGGNVTRDGVLEMLKKAIVES